jgi:hypothetical protein
MKFTIEQKALIRMVDMMRLKLLGRKRELQPSHQR